MSLRTRLLSALLGAVFMALSIVGVATYLLVSRSQLDQVDQELERAHPPIERAAANRVGDRERAIGAAAPGFYVELRDAQGATVLIVPLRRPGEETTSLEGVEMPRPTSGLSDDEPVFASIPSSGEHQLRVRVSRQSDDGILVIARSIESVEDTQERLLIVLLLATAGALLAAGLVGVALVRVGLRPLVAVADTAGEIGDAELDRRVPGNDESTEVGRLAIAINRMLDRLHAAFEQRADDLVELRESEARMRRFVADASHELRTPIAATAAYAELFERGARDRPDDLERAMTGIRSETARMADLVEDLLVLAQLDEGRPIARDEVDLAELAIEAADSARTVAPDRAVALRIDDPVIVTGDAIRLRQVLDNLLGNVRAHTPVGTACRLTITSDGGDALITVADDGPGMAAADAQRAFDRFHRADTSRTRASGGAGLGLSIVAAIVAAHDGTATMTSEPGVGTTVTIRLPITGQPS